MPISILLPRTTC